MTSSEYYPPISLEDALAAKQAVLAIAKQQGINAAVGIGAGTHGQAYCVKVSIHNKIDEGAFPRMLGSIRVEIELTGPIRAQGGI